VLIPLVPEICTTVDPGAKRIVIDPPKGLLEINR
jgi:ribosomal 30S subunit maturation factor RimM